VVVATRFVEKKLSNPKWGYERRVPTVTAGDVHGVVCAILAERA
jgi:hypothetical protein